MSPKGIIEPQSDPQEAGNWKACSEEEATVWAVVPNDINIPLEYFDCREEAETYLETELPA